MSASFCSTGSNITTSQCQDFCLVNPNACISSYKNYCSTDGNIANSTCQTWCKTGQNRAFCDPIVVNYCNANSFEEDFCGCINLQSQQQWIDRFDQYGFTAKPECNFKNCSANANAYKTLSMTKTVCDTTFCFQNVNLEALSGYNNIDKITQNCRLLNNSTVLQQSADLSKPISAITAAIIAIGVLAFLFIVIGLTVNYSKGKL